MVVGSPSIFNSYLAPINPLISALLIVGIMNNDGTRALDRFFLLRCKKIASSVEPDHKKGVQQPRAFISRTFHYTEYIPSVKYLDMYIGT